MDREFKWRFKLSDGESLVLPQRDVHRTLDKRGSWETPRLVYEVTVNGIVRRLWPEEIAQVEQVKA